MIKLKIAESNWIIYYLFFIQAPTVNEDFDVGFINELCAAPTDDRVVGDVISEILHCAANRLVRRLFFYKRKKKILMNFFSKKGHNTVIKILKTSNVNVNEILKNLPNRNEFLKEKVKEIIFFFSKF